MYIPTRGKDEGGKANRKILFEYWHIYAGFPEALLSKFF
jgi:hypothetical protein